MQVMLLGGLGEQDFVGDEEQDENALVEEEAPGDGSELLVDEGQLVEKEEYEPEDMTVYDDYGTWPPPPSTPEYGGASGGGGSESYGAPPAWWTTPPSWYTTPPVETPTAGTPPTRTSPQVKLPPMVRLAPAAPLPGVKLPTGGFAPLQPAVIFSQETPGARGIPVPYAPPATPIPSAKLPPRVTAIPPTVINTLLAAQQGKAGPIEYQRAAAAAQAAGMSTAATKLTQMAQKAAAGQGIPPGQAVAAAAHARNEARKRQQQARKRQQEQQRQRQQRRTLRELEETMSPFGTFGDEAEEFLYGQDVYGESAIGPEGQVPGYAMDESGEYEDEGYISPEMPGYAYGAPKAQLPGSPYGYQDPYAGYGYDPYAQPMPPGYLPPGYGYPAGYPQPGYGMPPYGGAPYGYDQYGYQDVTGLFPPGTPQSIIDAAVAIQNGTATLQMVQAAVLEANRMGYAAVAQQLIAMYQAMGGAYTPGTGTGTTAAPPRPPCVPGQAPPPGGCVPEGAKCSQRDASGRLIIGVVQGGKCVGSPVAAGTPGTRPVCVPGQAPPPGGCVPEGTTQATTTPPGQRPQCAPGQPIPKGGCVFGKGSQKPPMQWTMGPASPGVGMSDAEAQKGCSVTKGTKLCPKTGDAGFFALLDKPVGIFQVNDKDIPYLWSWIFSFATTQRFKAYYAAMTYDGNRLLLKKGEAEYAKKKGNIEKVFKRFNLAMNVLREANKRGIVLSTYA